MTDIERLEEKIAHLTRTVEELSEVVARQDKELAVAQRRVAMLMEREAMRAADNGTEIPLADQRPPHW
jgi:SlyX protein